MLFYNKKIGVTQEEFNTCQVEVKNAIREIVDNYKAILIKTFPLTKVEYVVSLKGEELQNHYKFLFKKSTEEGSEDVFAELVINIVVVDSEDNNK
jgi:hypothetical protein